MLRTLPERLIGFAMRHARIVVLATFAATLVFAWFAVKVRVNPDYISLLPVNEKSAKILKEYGGDAVAPDVLMLAVTADGSGGGLFEPGRRRAGCRRRRRVPRAAGSRLVREEPRRLRGRHDAHRLLRGGAAR